MSYRLAAVWQSLIPQVLVCRIIYRISRCPLHWIAAPLNAWFCSHYKLDLSEAEKPAPGDYPTLNALFTRALAPGARPVAAAPNAVVSPVDGTLTQFGTIDAGTLLQAKGMHYSLAALAGESDAAMDPFIGGEFATIYLAPHNYHRVHSPLASALVQTRYVPGTRFAVNAATAASVPNLFCRNERAVLWLEDANLSCLLVMVGALNVSSISTVARGEIPSGSPGLWREASPPPLAAGAEVGRFNLGSTVIMIFPRGSIEWRDGLGPATSLLMGERIATLTGAGR